MIVSIRRSFIERESQITPHIRPAHTSRNRYKCEYVAEFLRGQNNEMALQRDPGWAVYTFQDGTTIPTDASGSRVGLADARLMAGRIKRYLSLPVTPAEWGMFLSVRYASCWEKSNLFGDPQNKHCFTQISLEEWRQIDTSALDKWQKETVLLSRGATIF